MNVKRKIADWIERMRASRRGRVAIVGLCVGSLLAASYAIDYVLGPHSGSYGDRLDGDMVNFLGIVVVVVHSLQESYDWFKERRARRQKRSATAAAAHR